MSSDQLSESECSYVYSEKKKQETMVKTGKMNATVMKVTFIAAPRKKIQLMKCLSNNELSLSSKEVDEVVEAAV